MTCGPEGGGGFSSRVSQECGRSISSPGGLDEGFLYHVHTPVALSGELGYGQSRTGAQRGVYLPTFLALLTLPPAGLIFSLESHLKLPQKMPVFRVSVR